MNVADPMIASSTSQRQRWKGQFFLLSLSLGKEYTFTDLPLCPELGVVSSFPNQWPARSMVILFYSGFILWIWEGILRFFVTYWLSETWANTRVLFVREKGMAGLLGMQPTVYHRHCPELGFWFPWAVEIIIMSLWWKVLFNLVFNLQPMSNTF